MMSGHSVNPIFFNKRIKIGSPEHLLTPHLPMSDSISFLPYPPTPLKADVICVSPLNQILTTSVVSFLVLPEWVLQTHPKFLPQKERILSLVVVRDNPERTFSRFLVLNCLCLILNGLYLYSLLIISVIFYLWYSTQFLHICYTHGDSPCYTIPFMIPVYCPCLSL